MLNYAVLTGDIKGYTRLKTAARDRIMKSLQKKFKTLVSKPSYAELYRGDSFQLLFEDIEKAVWSAIRLRCEIRGFRENKKSQPILDAKICIGIGKVSNLNDRVLISDGEAFHLSGRGFDSLQEEEDILIVTPQAELNEQLKTINNLMNLVIRRWTPSQAQVIAAVMDGKTQNEISEQLGITQPSVHKRIKLADWKEIERAIVYIGKVIKQSL